MPEAYTFWSLPLFEPRKVFFLLNLLGAVFCKFIAKRDTVCRSKGRWGRQKGRGGWPVGSWGPDLYMLLQPLLVILQLAAALLLLTHAGLQL